MKIGLLGFGTVGSGVFNIINSSEFKLFEVSKILVRNKEKYSKFSNLITTSLEEVINSDVDIVVEVMGGHDFAYKAMVMALKNKKHVVTANKNVVSKHLEELLALAKENNVCFLFEASVAGGIPIINNILNNNKMNKINGISGILNGSTNYILSLLQDTDITYDDAIKLAFDKGFLEADPTDDLHGIDMLRKIAILSMLSYFSFIDLEDIYAYPLSGVSKEFINVLNKAGYKLRYAASSFLENDIVGMRIEPVAVLNSNLMSVVNNETNVVVLTTNNTDVLTFSGPGAGSVATGNAIVSDLIMILENRGSIDFAFKNNYKVTGNNDFIDRYIIDGKNLSEDIIDYMLDGYIVSKPISGYKLNQLKDNINFYARIGE